MMAAAGCMSSGLATRRLAAAAGRGWQDGHDPEKPARPRPPRQDGAGLSRIPGETAMRVLLVEDEAVLRAQLKQMLIHAGYAVDGSLGWTGKHRIWVRPGPMTSWCSIWDCPCWMA